MPVENYPPNLQPKQNYKVIAPDAIASDAVTLIRRSLLGSQVPFDELRILKSRALVTNLKEIFGLSLNLLGGEFEPEHIKYVTKSPGSSSWTTGEEVLDLEKIKSCTEEVNAAFPIFFLVTEIAPVAFPFQKKYDKTSIKKIPQSLALNVDFDNNTATYNSSSQVQHRPSHGNFWHVEFHIFDESESPKKLIAKGESGDPDAQISSGSPWKIFVAHHYFNLLKVKAKEKPANTTPIQKELYQ